MKIYLLIKIILCGLFLLGLISAFIYVCFKSENFLTCIAAIFLIILVGYLPACFFYYDVMRYNSQPEPTNKIEKCINGITYIQYQDINHFCHYGENATVFTSLMPLDGKASQTDTCIICHKSFLHHDTKDEQDFFQSIIEANEGACLAVNHDEDINFDVL